MTRAAYVGTEPVTCPHCKRSMAARGMKNHASRCICEPARSAAIADALSDPDRPGFGLARERYNVIAAERGLLQGQALAEQVADHIGQWAKWRDVLRYFGLSWVRRAGDEDAAALIAVQQAADDKAAADAALEAERVAVRGLPVFGGWSDVRTKAEHWMVR
jgi:hypothetical protein